MEFTFRPLDIPGLMLIDSGVARDRRGAFHETYKRSVFAAQGIAVPFVQDNLSHSVKGVLRGLHYQTGRSAQGKLVMAVRGEIFDVAVDLRRDTPTFGRWAGVSLSEENRQMLYIPPGFAHGFGVVSDEAVVVYKITAEYDAAAERGIIWNDPKIAIAWPITHPILSDRDAALPTLEAAARAGDLGAANE